MFYPILSAILLWLALDQLQFNWFVWWALVPLFFFLKNYSSKKNNFLAFFVFGLVFFWLFFLWLLVLKEWAGSVIYLGWFGLGIYSGLFYLVPVWLTRYFYRKLTPFGFWLGVPAVWVVFEWLRGIGPFGVTLGNWATSQSQNFLLLKLTSIAGIYGVDFLIVLVNVTVFLILEGKYGFFSVSKNRWLGWFLVAGLVFSLQFFGTNFFRKMFFPKSESLQPHLQVAGIQPGIAQGERLDYSKLSDNFDQQIQLTRQVPAGFARRSLIVWPEGLPVIIDSDHPYFKKLSSLALEKNSALLVGAFTEKQSPSGQKRLHNSVLLFDNRGHLLGVYRKHQPVPFGEYLPFRPIFYPLVKNTGFFEDDQAAAPLITLRLINLQPSFETTLGTIICFESTFSGICRNLTQKGAEVFFVLTNDAWFKKSRGVNYHLMFLPFRAAETGRYFFQVANTGISAVVAPDGSILGQTHLNQKEILKIALPLKQQKTIYTRWGDWPIFCSFLLIFFCFVYKKSG